MNYKLLIALLILITCPYPDLTGQSTATAERVGSRIDIYIDGNLFTSYRFSQDEKYPFFFPVNGPSGFSVTSMRNALFPHHSSLFFGCDFVNGGNYWQEGLERGQIISVRADIIESGGERVVIENECIWARPGAESPIRDTRRITVSAPSGSMFLIDFSIALQMLEDVFIRRNNHSLFSARMAHDLAVTGGGVMIDSGGDTGEKGTFGKPSPWIANYGKRSGGIEGLTIMQHPSNQWYPAPWFTRDYGFFSPTPIYWPEDGQGTSLPKGKTVELHYRVLVHSGDHVEADIAGQFYLFKSEKPSKTHIPCNGENF
jgi:hypothetical protein